MHAPKFVPSNQSHLCILFATVKQYIKACHYEQECVNSRMCINKGACFVVVQLASVSLCFFFRI